MKSSINTYSLKERFYNQHFKEYRDFLHGTDLSPRNRRVMSETLNRVNEQVIKRSDNSKNLFPITLTQDRNNPEREYIIAPRLKQIQNELNEVVSVEEFFSIVGQNESLKEKVNQILLFTEKESGNGTIPELQQTTEDTILRSICGYFWKKYDKKDITGKDGYIFHYNDLKSYRFEEIINIIGSIITFNSGIISFLHICRKIRNNDVHNEGILFGLKDGYDINCFRLFTYIGTVLLLRMCLEEKGFMPAYQFDKLIMPVSFPEGSPCDIKLFSGKEIIPPIKTKRKKRGIIEYEVEWYRPYRLEITKYNISEEKTFEWGDFSPIANFDGTQIKIDGKESQAPSNVRNRSFQHIAQSIDEIMNVLGSIDTQTGNIDNTLTSIDSKLDIFLSYCKVYFDKYIDQQNGFQEKLLKTFQEWVKRESKNNTLEQILEILSKQYQLRLTSEECKRKQQKAIYTSILGISLLIILIFQGCNFLFDNSILWVRNKTLIICIIALTFILLIMALIRWYRLSKVQVVKKIFIFIGFIILFLLSIAGSYVGIPYKSTHDFIQKYDFFQHSTTENKKVVTFLESILNRDPKSEQLLIKLATYYLKYDKDTIQALKIINPMKDVRAYPSGCMIASETLMAHGDYTETGDLIDEYRHVYGHSEPTFDRLLGIMDLFGYGREQDNGKGLHLLSKACQAGDKEACYYLGYYYSHDMTNWKDSKRKGLLQRSNFDLAEAALYYKMAAKMFPKAALELGKLYADLNVVDSASHYLRIAIDNTEYDVLLHNEALFQLGLLFEKQGQRYNEYMNQAKHAHYSPAILHTALTEQDHITAIARYEKAGTYKGYRYIPPVAFEYLALGDSVKALRAMQQTRPDGNFDKNFVSAMQRILGTPYVEKDSVMAIKYMQKSAEAGCRFARMLCLFRQMERSQQEGKPENYEKHKQLEAMGEHIPFAYALDAWLCRLEKGIHIRMAENCDKAMSYGHPAGAFILVGLQVDALNIFMNYNIKKGEKYLIACWLTGMYQKALRMTSNKQQIIDEQPFKQLCIIMAWDYLQKFYKEIKDKFENNNTSSNTNPKTDLSLEDINFWMDVIIANHCFDEECLLLIQYLLPYEITCRLMEAALADARPECPQENLTTLSTRINLMPSSFTSQLDKKYKNDSFRQELLHSERYNKFKSTPELEEVENHVVVTASSIIMNSFSDKQLLLELSDWTDSDYDNNFLNKFKY